MAVLDRDDEQSALTRSVPLDGSESDESGPEECSTAVRDAKRAYRFALGALLLSGLLFVVALGSVVRAALSGGPVAPTNVQEVVGLSTDEKAQVLKDSVAALAGSFGRPGTGLFDEDEDDGEVLLPTRYSLLQSAKLRTSPGVEKGGRTLPKGAKVFVLKHNNGWIQVVVARGEGIPAGFGWLPLKENGEELLEADALPQPTGETHIQPTPEQRAQIDKRWDEVRSQNDDLKLSLAKLQDSLRDQFIQKMKKKNMKKAPPAPTQDSDSTTAAPFAPEISKVAADVVDVSEVKKDVANIKSSVREELKASPKKVFHDLGSLFH